MANEVVNIEQVVYGLEEVFNGVLVDKSMSFRQEAEFALQTLYAPANSYMREIAAKNPQSVRDAITNVAAIGISLNPAKKEAYLVPRKGGVCLDISYVGLATLAIASGSVLWVKSEIVRQGDEFILNGYDKPPTHNYQPFGTDRGEAVGAYVVAKTRDGDYLTDTMPIEEINAIRDRSEAWKAWIGKKKSCPWVTDPGEMQKKTVVKRASKMWPKTDRLSEAVHYLNTDGGQGVEFDNSVAQPVAKPSGAPAFSLGNILARIDAAKNETDLAAVRKEGQQASSDNRDKASYERITAAAKRKRDQLRGVTDAVEVAR